MTDLRKAAEMALETLCVGANDAVPNDIDERFEQAIQALRQALAQSEQEFVGACVTCGAPKGEWLVDAVNITAERVDETAKGGHDSLGSEWVECVKLPIVVHVRKQRDGETHISTREGITPVLSDDLIMRGVAGEEYPIGRELFERTYTFDTAPPKREWVGLTRRELDIATLGLEDLGDCYIAIEAKLKEKNT